MPASITVRVTGMPEFERKMRDIPLQVRRGAIQGLTASGLLVQNYAKNSILKGPKSGRIYRKYNPRRLHQASAPGQPPANDTGTLVRSIVMDVDETELEVTISAGTFYAKMLEYGTRLMAARPFMRPAIFNNAEKIKNTIIAYVRRAMK